MYLAIDTETTGLTNLCNVLTAYFIVLDENLNEIKHLDLKIKHCSYHVYTKALEVNKIDLIEHDKVSTPKKEAILKLEEFLSGVEERYIPIGHNVEFDINMLEDNGMDIHKYIKSPYIDTYVICKKLKHEKKINDKQSLALGKISYFFGVNIDCKKLHTSEYDVRLSIELFKYIKNYIL